MFVSNNLENTISLLLSIYMKSIIVVGSSGRSSSCTSVLGFGLNRSSSPAE